MPVSSAIISPTHVVPKNKNGNLHHYKKSKFNPIKSAFPVLRLVINKKRSRNNNKKQEKNSPPHKRTNLNIAHPTHRPREVNDGRDDVAHDLPDAALSVLEVFDTGDLDLRPMRSMSTHYQHYLQ